MLERLRFPGTLVLLGTLTFARGQDLHKHVAPLDPEESLSRMVLQDDYRLELVAAEPLVEEPTLFAFDGNGRMYVAEMLTYMQDADGSEQFLPRSRIKRLEDSDGDGVMDTATVFADGLLLPRMIQTLDDGQILVRETNTRDVLLIADSDGDGVADQRTKAFEGGPRGGNLEHQPSGLIWGIDNWLYVTYENTRYRYRKGKLNTQTIPYGGGQWGIAQDDVGRMYYSAAGGEDPAFGFQFPIVYGRISVEGEQAPGFREVFPLDRIPDVQNGAKRLREDNTLNAFTGVGGQSIYLGDRLPDELYGNLFLPEPVGHLVRRAIVNRESGYSILTHPYQGQRAEFIASTDPNFRPVWCGTDPYGTLMIVDMYRGIIQESNWTKEGSYLRTVIDRFGLDRNIGRGRIYRLVHETTRLGELPRFFESSPVEWVQKLAHPNGWWRFEAQKLLVLRKDPETIEPLKEMARSHPEANARLHSLWALEGMGEIDRDLLLHAFRDGNGDVRSAAIRISEPYAAARDERVIEHWLRLAESHQLEVAQQALLSAYYTEQSANVKERIEASARAAHPEARGIEAIMENVNWMEQELVKRQRLASRGEELMRAVEAGKRAYASLCYTCHGVDGRGTKGLDGSLLAPSLSDSDRVQGDVASLARILLHGLSGTNSEMAFGAEIMPAMGTYDDRWIADTLTYLRNSHGNEASLVTERQVSAVRALESGRVASWTAVELEDRFGRPLDERQRWRASSNDQSKGIERTHDGDLDTRWTTRSAQTAGTWLQIELPRVAEVSQVILNAGYSLKLAAQGYRVEFSLDGTEWTTVDENRQGRPVSVSETLGRPTRFARISIVAGSPDRRWAVHEVTLLGNWLEQ